MALTLKPAGALATNGGPGGVVAVTGDGLPQSRVVPAENVSLHIIDYPRNDAIGVGLPWVNVPVAEAGDARSKLV